MSTTPFVLGNQSVICVAYIFLRFGLGRCFVFLSFHLSFALRISNIGFATRRGPIPIPDEFDRQA